MGPGSAGASADSARLPYLQVVFLTIGITALGTVVVLNVPWLPDQASDEAAPTDTLYDILAVASVFVFALVMSILIVSVLRFRKRRFGDESDGQPIHGHTGLEILWTSIPAVIMVVAAVASGVVLADIEEKKPGTQTSTSPASSSPGPSITPRRASSEPASCISSRAPPTCSGFAPRT